MRNNFFPYFPHSAKHVKKVLFKPYISHDEIVCELRDGFCQNSGVLKIQFNFKNLLRGLFFLILDLHVSNLQGVSLNIYLTWYAYREPKKGW